jgi:hypothetical protein
MFTLTLLSILALAVVVAVGAGIVAVIASLPNSILARSENGRFAGLGSDAGTVAGKGVSAPKHAHHPVGALHAA